MDDLSIGNTDRYAYNSIPCWNSKYEQTQQKNEEEKKTNIAFAVIVQFL